ncbi:hypothetical protein ACFX5K_00250 [Rickettsiales bacterium LUAb2]
MKKLLILLSLIVICLLKVNYVHAIINNSNNHVYNQYYEIDFIYKNVINGKAYTEETVLLRNKTWLQENNINKAGDSLILNIPEFGVVNAKATVKLVKATNINLETSYNNNESIVTGTFKHYSTDVREYTLKDLKTNQVQTVQATPNHAFYVSNRIAFNKALNESSHFIEIQDITPNDKMLNDAGNTVQLVCDNNICGKQLVKNNKPLPVYNLEIFKQHQYLVVSNKGVTPNKFIINNAVLVHNGPCFSIPEPPKDENIINFTDPYKYINNNNEIKSLKLQFRRPGFLLDKEEPLYFIVHGGINEQFTALYEDGFLISDKPMEDPIELQNTIANELKDGLDSRPKASMSKEYIKNRISEELSTNDAIDCVFMVSCYGGNDKVSLVKDMSEAFQDIDFFGSKKEIELNTRIYKDTNDNELKLLHTLQNQGSSSWVKYRNGIQQNM